MFDIRVAYFPIGRKTFDMEVAETYFNESLTLLKSQCPHLLSPEHILTSVDELKQFIADHASESQPELVVFQPITFADAEFIVEVMEHYSSQSIFVWSVREPSVGGRLRLNSLTGGNSACNALKYFGRDFEFLLGNPDEPAILRRLHAVFAAVDMVHKLKRLTVGVIGDHPPGFFFSGADELELMKLTGTKIHHFDLHSIFKKSMELSEEHYLPMIESASARVVGLKKDEETTIRFAKFSTYLKRHMEQHGIKATAVRCWPDFFNEIGAAACSTLSQFIEDGIMSSCESDINGVITMYIQQVLSGGLAPYLGDLVHLDEERNSVCFWHCGAGAYSLANARTGAKAGVHPNRKLGFTLEFGLKPGPVTIARLGRTSKGYRMLIMKGEALDSPQQFYGTSGEVRLAGDAKATLYALMQEGLEPHYSIVHADIVDELAELAKRLGIETLTYVD